MASFLKQLSDDMERVAQVIEDGAKFVMGEYDHIGEHTKNAASDPTTGGIFEHDNIDEDANLDTDGLADTDIEDSLGSPLMGMADSVMSDIMSSQACDCRVAFCCVTDGIVTY